MKTTPTEIEKIEPYSNWGFWLITVALIAGLALSFFSWLELCIEQCSASQEYLIFNIPFAIFGMAFFVVAIVLHFMSRSTPVCSDLLGWMIASALGAELMFIEIQRSQIGHWCPLCLSIAGFIAIAALVLLTGFAANLKKALQQHNRGETMRSMRRAVTSISFMALGFIMALIGISKPDSAAAAVKDMKERVAFGTKNAPIDVYFVSDWFCPSCKKIEPIIEKIYPKINSKVTFYFVDYPIHRKSMNFAPYNLAFLVNDKRQYFKARRMLIALAEKTDSPTDEDVEKLAKKEGIPFKELSYLEVKNGMEYFEGIIEKYNLKSTPTIIITNPKRNVTIVLEGRDEISEEKILKAIENRTSHK